ncbi:MAG: response regulator transcription factor [Coriobacteriia bacterium]|nr:response regulator transcription factor [Coriobacteriia bacterium]
MDEDRGIVEVLTGHLDAAGFSAEGAHDAASAVALAERRQPDLALVDVALPDPGGYELADHFCSRDIAVILVSAHSDEATRLRGFEIGADDFIAKPFSPREVVARAKAVLRRRRPEAEPAGEVLQCDGLTVDVPRRSVCLNGVPADLTRAEFDIVLALARRRGAVCTRSQLLEAVSDGATLTAERTVDAHIKNIRRKLGLRAYRPERIRTVPGVGYQL